MPKCNEHVQKLIQELTREIYEINNAFYNLNKERIGDQRNMISLSFSAMSGLIAMMLDDAVYEDKISEFIDDIATEIRDIVNQIQTHKKECHANHNHEAILTA